MGLSVAGVWPAAKRSSGWRIKVSVVGVDVLAVALAMLFAYVLTESVLGASRNGPFASNATLGLFSLPIWLICIARCGLYRLKNVTDRLSEFRRIVRATLCSLLATASLGFALKIDASRGWLALLFCTAVIALTTGRGIVRSTLATRRRRGELLRSVLVVGGNAEALALAETLTGDPAHGYRVLGFLSDHPLADPVAGLSILGSVGETLDVALESGASCVMIASSAVDPAIANRLVRRLGDVGIHVELSLTLRDVATRRLTMRPIGRHPILHLEPARRSGSPVAAKRCFDVVFAAVILLCATPIVLVAMASIRVDSRGPALFRQRRVGKDGKPFSVLKLRTMVQGAEALLPQLLAANEADGPLFKMRNDPRTTRIGRVLRKFSIDEIPQLWNVLRGEMSLVGPRPALPSEMERWHADLRGRLRVKPGITGVWQVSGRSNSSFDEYATLDLYYIDNWSFSADLAILLRTIPVVMMNRGAY